MFTLCGYKTSERFPELPGVKIHLKLLIFWRFSIGRQKFCQVNRCQARVWFVRRNARTAGVSAFSFVIFWFFGPIYLSDLRGCRGRREKSYAQARRHRTLAASCIPNIVTADGWARLRLPGTIGSSTRI
jgi:hypothetical protein